MSGENWTDVFPFNLWESNSSSQNSNRSEEDKENESPGKTVAERQLRVNLDDLYYDMSGEKHLIILNQHRFKNSQYFECTPSDRDGTSKDAARLKQVFRKLGFTVKEHKNLEYHEIITLLYEINNTDYSGTSCIAVAILTHGDKGGVIYAADRPYNLCEIVRIFDQQRTLLGKPKLFFVQACRGDRSDAGHMVSTDGHCRRRSGHVVLPTLCDTLIMRSCVENFYSYRGKGGSWLIQELAATIEKYHKSMDFLHICTLTQQNVAWNNATYNPNMLAEHNKKQMPETTFTLTKLLRL